MTVAEGGVDERFVLLNDDDPAVDKSHISDRFAILRDEMDKRGSGIVMSEQLDDLEKRKLHHQVRTGFRSQTLLRSYAISFASRNPSHIATTTHTPDGSKSRHCEPYPTQCAPYSQ
jgi:hypothetical protein